MGSDPGPWELLRRSGHRTERCTCRGNGRATLGSIEPSLDSILMNSSVAVFVLAGSPLRWALDIACPLVLPDDPPPPEAAESACAPKPLTWLQGLLKPMPPPDPVLLWMGDAY